MLQAKSISCHSEARFASKNRFFHGSWLLVRAPIFPQRFAARNISERKLFGILLLRTDFWRSAVSHVRMDVTPVDEILPSRRNLALDRSGRSACVCAHLVSGQLWTNPSSSALPSLLRIT